MNFIFSGKDDVRSKALEELVTKKLTKITNRLNGADTTIEVNFAKENKDFVLTTQIFADGEKLFAKVKSDDMYKNIDECVRKLTTQLNKLKDIK